MPGAPHALNFKPAFDDDGHANSKSEIRNPNDESNSNDEIRNGIPFGHSDFGFDSSFGFRISDFT